jgi:hypothetical protein
MSLMDVVEGALGTASSGPEPARRAMLDKLDEARRAFEEDRSDAPGGRWITKAEEGRVAFAPTRPDGQQLVIGGQAVTFWQASELSGVLDAFERAVEAGELDPQLTGDTPAGHSLPLERLMPVRSS